jgi:protein-tyrosine phosphatase
MDELIDIHSHILFGLDDGSKNMDQTLNMLKIAYSEGIRKIITTPHFQDGVIMNAIPEVEARLSEVQNKIADSKLDMILYMGSEIYYSHDVIDLLNAERIPTMAGSKYVLVEFSPMAEFAYIKDGLQRLLLEGYLPILAHAERYNVIIKKYKFVKDLIDMGVFIQVNALSIEGATGRSYEKASKKLIKKQWVHFLATDCHSDRTRVPRLKKAIHYIAKKQGDYYVTKLLSDNPNYVLKNQYIEQ